MLGSPTTPRCPANQVTSFDRGTVFDPAALRMPSICSRAAWIKALSRETNVPQTVCRKL